AVTGSATILSSPATGAGTRPYSAMHWRMIGPFRGGRVLAVTGVPGDPSRFYFGSVAGGVWRTDDAGRTWKPIFDDQPIASIGAIALAYSDPNVVYVGSGEADMRSDITYGNGMYKSVDAGKTWRHIGLDDTRQIGKVAVDPTDPNRVFVAALGHAYAPNTARGVYRSDDGGATSRLADADPRLWQRGWYFCKLVVDPKDENVVYVSDTAFYRSTDGGRHFTAIKGSPDGDDFHQPWIDPTDPSRMIVGTDQGATVSLNRGATWSSWFNQPTAQFYHIAADDRFPFR